MEDKTAALNGYKVRSYGDLLAVASLCTMLLAVVAWGLKLEARLDVVRDDLMHLNRQVGTGILPRAEERIEALNRELLDIRREMEEHRGDKHE